MITGYEKVLLINSEDFVSQEHVGYYTSSSDSIEIQLIEIVRVKYRHPDARDVAVVEMLEYKHRGTYRRYDRPDLVILESSLKVVKELQALKG